MFDHGVGQLWLTIDREVVRRVEAEGKLHGSVVRLVRGHRTKSSLEETDIRI